MKYISSKLNCACDGCGKRTELFEFPLQTGKVRLCRKCIGDMAAFVIETPKESKSKSETEAVRQA